MDNWDFSKAWFHRSPVILNELLVGSTITQDRNLARIFSHKPSIVAKDENGMIFHNGKEEWLIRRPLKVKKIEDTEPSLGELLSDEDEKILKKG